MQMKALTKDELKGYQRLLPKEDYTSLMTPVPVVSPTAPFRVQVTPYMLPGTPAFLATAATIRYEGVEDKGKCHTASIFCFKEGTGEFKYVFSCGDGFLTGQIKAETAEFRVRDVAVAYPGLRPALSAAHGSSGVDTKCGFWSSISRNKESGGCKHVRAMLAQAVKPCASGKPWDILDALEAEYVAATGGAVLSEAPAPRIPLGKGVLYGEFESLLAKHLEYKAPVLVMGPRGASKTWTARQFMREHGFDVVVESNGHAGLEAIDFIGGPLPMEGRMIWKDGPVARAFRAASQGKKVLLLIDEIYRVPRRERSIFLTALSPEGDKTYRLPTGRPVNIRTEGGSEVADEEVLEAPVENLSIVATTNIGSEYEIEDDDPAQKDRWVHIFVKTEEARLREILMAVVRGRGWGDSLATKLVNFWKNSLKMKADRLLESTPNVRTMVRVVRMARSEKDVKVQLNRLALALVAVNAEGEPVKEQIQAAERAIKLEFGS